MASDEARRGESALHYRGRGNRIKPIHHLLISALLFVV